MHRSLMRISERPSVYLAARSQHPQKATSPSKEDAKKAAKPSSLMLKKSKEDKDKSDSEAESTVSKEKSRKLSKAQEEKPDEKKAPE